MTQIKTVYVGMSGGVDSSVTAALLKEQGFHVVGVFMKNWSKDLPGMKCPWLEDFQDAKRVAVQLGIEFRMYDFEKEYFDRVVQYMLDEYKAGRTPNPDIMCNQEVKFKLFLDAALRDGADYIATGHYARTSNGCLLTAVDDNKDQTYFLYRVDEAALQRTLFPIGEFSKPDVRIMAEARGLYTAKKKDSQGICFVGQVGIRDFLDQYITSSPGPIIDQNGAVVGEHDGAIYYTIGQRHGLNVGGGLPYYVADKNMDTNTVFVTTDLQDARLWRDSIRLGSMHWINAEPDAQSLVGVQARTRHRAHYKDIIAAEKHSDTTWTLQLDSQERAVTPGQSVVLYDGERVLGGGIVI